MIKRLVMQNIGPHRHFAADFQPGVIGIFGPNGSGKTFLLNAVRLLLTGEFAAFGGVKAEAVNLACANEPAFVEGVLELGGRTLEIRRGLHRAKSALLLDGEKYETAADIRAALQRLLGCSADALSAAAFKGQGELDAIVAAPPAKRSDALQAVYGLSRFEKMYDRLGAKISEDAGFLQAPDNYDQTLALLTDAETRLTAAQAARQAVRLLTSAGEAARRDCVNAASAAAAASVAAQRARQSLAAAQNELAQAAVADGQAQQVLSAAAGRAVPANAVAAARQVLADGQTAAHVRAIRSQHEKRLTAALGELAHVDRSLAAVGGAPTVERLGAAAADLQERERRQQAAAQLLRTFDQTGLTACPTCGTSVAGLAGVLEDARQCADDTDRITQLRDYIRDGRIARTKLDELTRWREAAQRERDALATQATCATGPDPSAEQLGAAGQLLRDADAAARGLQAAQQTAAAATARATAAKRHAAQAETAIPVVPPGPAPTQVAQANQDLALHAQESQRAARLDGEIRELTHGVTQHRQWLETLRARRALTDRRRQRLGALTAARAVMHRSALPMAILRSASAEAAANLPAWLDVFGSPFSVEFDAHLSFVVTKPGFPPHAGAMLSGAQRAILALAFWLAAPSPVPLLVLDEPTSFLDAQNRNCLAEAFKRLANAHSGRQILVTTHAADIGYAFDQVITLEAARV